MYPFLLAGCTLSEQKTTPEKISGVWELHQVETASGTVEGLRWILDKYSGPPSSGAGAPKCTWARMSWTFADDHIDVGVDVLCQTGAGDFYGCEVAASVPATWNPDLGQWTVPHPVAVRSRTAGLDESAVAGPTQCEVSVDAGTYVVERVRPKEGDWRWEMSAPKGVVFRLRLPRSDRPDFVSAIRETTSAASSEVQP